MLLAGRACSIGGWARQRPDRQRTPACLQGMRVRPDGPQLISQLIRKELNLDCRWAYGAGLDRLGRAGWGWGRACGVAGRGAGTVHLSQPSYPLGYDTLSWWGVALPGCMACSVLMGANIAGDIAKGELSEATIAYSVLENAVLLQVAAGGVGKAKTGACWPPAGLPSWAL